MDAKLDSGAHGSFRREGVSFGNHGRLSGRCGRQIQCAEGLAMGVDSCSKLLGMVTGFMMWLSVG